MKSKVNYSLVLGILQSLIGVGAILAGIGFLNDPSGNQNFTTAAILSNSPFPDFFIPGLFLLLFNGIGNILSAFVSFSKKEVSGFLGILFGIILMAWVVLQVYWIGYLSILQPVYFILGGIEAGIGFILLKNVIRGNRTYVADI